MAALNLLDFINTLAAQQQPPPVASVDPAPPAPGTAVLPGGESGSSSPLGTVLATLRRVGPGPRVRAALGGGANVKAAPSRGGAIAQGFMQGMQGAAEYDARQAERQRLLDAFDYRKAKDLLDQQYREKQDAIRNKQAQDRLDTWRKVGRGKTQSKLAKEKSILDVLGKDPDYTAARDALSNDDEQTLPRLKLTSEARDALKAKMKEREAVIRKLADEDDDEGDDGDTTPAPAAKPKGRSDGLVNPLPPPRPDETTPAPADVPLPPPRPAGLGAPPAAAPPAPTPSPAAAPVIRPPVGPEPSVDAAGNPSITLPPSAMGGPPVPGARQAPDGNWYVQQDGRYFRVEQ